MPPTHARYDTIIVGARPAGAATALLLARAGQRVLVLDRGGPDDDALSTHALMRPGVLLLHRWGVLDRIVAADTPAIRAVTFHYGDVALPVPTKPRDGIDALYAPRRTVLDPALVAAARAAGAEIHHHTKLRHLVRDSRGRVRGAIVESAGEVVEIGAELVIGADGVGSTVARLVAAPDTHRAHHVTATIYAHVPSSLDGYHWFYREGLGAGVIPTNGGACVFLVTPAARYRDELRHDLEGSFARALAEIAPDAARIVGPGARLRPFAGRHGYLRRASGPGWALVGDAGFFRDPFTAHGITDALRDAALLARELAGGGKLARYEAARDDLAVPMLELTDAISSFAWTLPEVGELHRQLQRLLARELDLVRELTAARVEAHDAQPSPYRSHGAHV